MNDTTRPMTDEQIVEKAISQVVANMATGAKPIESAIREAIRLARPQWVSVEDRLPEKAGEYIVGATGLCCTTMDWNGKRWISDFGPAFAVHITHWMPLPLPPNPTK